MPEYTTHDGDMIIEVSKVGGGTLGRRYEGAWRITAKQNDMVVLDDVVNTGTPKNHAEVSQMVPEFIEDAEDQYWSYFDAED